MQVDDEYARRFMAEDGEIFFFDKRTAPTWFRSVLLAGIGVAGVAVVGSAIGAHDPSALLALLPVGAAGLIQTTFWTLRTAVTKHFLYIQYGLVGPKIPIGDIESVDVVSYDWRQFGGFGVRRRVFRRETAYNMMGDQGRAVKIVYRRGNKTDTIFLSAEHPEQLRDAIATALTRNRNASALDATRDALGVRAAPVDDAAVNVDANANVDVDVAVDAANRRRP